MTPEERATLEAVQFTSVLTPEDVWSPITHHVEGLHEQAARLLLRSVPKATASSPVGIVLQGSRGVGKTHLLRWLRQHVEKNGGYFFLLKLLEGSDFWRSAVHGIVDGFYGGGGDQLGPLLRALGELAELSPLDRNRIAGTIPVTRDALDGLVAGLRRVDRQVADSQNTLRALVLYRADDFVAQEVGYEYLAGDGDVDLEAGRVWGFRPGARSKQLVLRDLSRLLAMTGPTVLAVDQIDTMISQRRAREGDGADRTLGAIANGLMELREVTRSTLSVVACLPASWTAITRNALNSAQDRFLVQTLQAAMPDPDIAERIVREHLGAVYTEVGFEPPYPTWPVAKAAFEDAGTRALTPRRLLQRVDEHVRRCLDADQVTELSDFAESVEPPDPVVVVDDARLAELDEQFTRLRAEADVRTPLESDNEDDRMPVLLGAGLQAYVRELGDAGQGFSVDRVHARKPAVHARLRQILDEGSEDEVHYAFRAIAHPHHRAVQSRLASARTEAGLAAGVDRRRLVLLRNTRWPSGRVTEQKIAEFEQLGGISVPLEESDLRTFAALERMLASSPPGWTDWLVSRRPAGGTELFRRLLPEVGADQTEATRPPTGATPPTTDDQPTRADPVEEPAADAVGAVGDERSTADGTVDGSSSPTPSSSVASDSQPLPAGRKPSPHPRQPMVPLGHVDRGPVEVELESLRKHTVVFAGSGSGKTVLLRRLVEECALHGVSAIVLDPNNDLSRLGDAWPSPPTDWLPGDDARAAAYLHDTQVVVWTPGRSRGRPLSFQPLPDLTGVLDDPDEFRMGVDSAVASLVPRTGLTGKKVDQGAAVLREALHHYARNGGQSLGGLIEMLAEFPEDLSRLRNATKLAADMAESLNAAMINDPLFGGQGEAVDPSVLLTPSSGARARISVISFIGLPAEDQRQSFVNQLQMALFSWVKKNPAGERPLGGLFVMDEAQTFAPAGAFTACTRSTIALASQARKYGLGLILATQAPRGLNNQISGNAATQFFGFLNAPAQIAAAEELARAKGSRVEGISRLGRGQFYVASEGVAFEKVREPMCLSHHPASPPTEEEVLERARRPLDDPEP